MREIATGEKWERDAGRTGRRIFYQRECKGTGGGGRGVLQLPYEKPGVFVVPLRGQSLRFWFHLGC